MESRPGHVTSICRSTDRGALRVLDQGRSNVESTTLWVGDDTGALLGNATSLRSATLHPRKDKVNTVTTRIHLGAAKGEKNVLYA
jgi:hypothetical protein